MIFWCDEQDEDYLESENSVVLDDLHNNRMQGYVTLLYHPLQDGFIDISPRDMLSIMFIATTTPIDQEPVGGWYRCCSTDYAQWLLSTFQIHSTRGSAYQPLPYNLRMMMQRKNVSKYIKLENEYVYASADHFCFGDTSITGVDSSDNLLRISLSKELIRGLIYNIKESNQAVALGCWMISLQLLNPTYNIMTTTPLLVDGNKPVGVSLYDIKVLCHLNNNIVKGHISADEDTCKTLLGYGATTSPTTDDAQWVEVLKPLVRPWAGDISGRLMIPQLWVSGNAYGNPESKLRGYSFPLQILIGDELYETLNNVGIQNLTLPSKWKW